MQDSDYLIQESNDDENPNTLMQKLLHKIMIWKFTGNLNKELKRRGIKQAEVSRNAGRVESAFNKTIKQVENLTLSSLIRYWVAIDKIIVEKGITNKIHFENIIDDEIKKIATIASYLYTEDLNYIAKIESDFFRGLKVHIEGLKDVKDGISSEQIALFEEIINRYGN